MSSPPAIPDDGNLRASDSDRERVADILRHAAGDGRLTMEELDERLDAVYAAKTYAELEPVTKDLPQAGTAHIRAPAQARAGDVDRIGGVPTSHTAIAILGAAVRKGDWVVPTEFNVVAVMGAVEIDFREARFSERVVTVHVAAVMGAVEITVPEDVTVRSNGIGIMASFEHTSGEGQPGAPEIVIKGAAIMGAVEVKRKPPRKPEREVQR